MFPQNITSYLNRFGADAVPVYGKTNTPYRFIVVIPAMDERNNLPVLIESLSNCELPGVPFAVMIVLNHCEGSSPEIKQENELTAEYLNGLINSDTLPFPLLLADVFSPGNEMPDKTGGVGLARKIGLDAALKLLDYGPGNAPFLVCLDADCTVSANYLRELHSYFSPLHTEAVSISFAHRLPENKKERDAILFYEIYLRYYVYMLRRSGLPYAMQTIGSSMAFTAAAYCRSEGMNKYKAGEDFYFLEKTAKHTAVGHINRASVYPSPRISYRVPFGTGRAMEDYLLKGEEYGKLYPAAAFTALQQVYVLLVSGMPENELRERIAETPGKSLVSLLDEKKLFAKRSKIVSSSRTAQQCEAQLVKLFDGFFILKAVHHLRDNGFPEIPYREALDSVFPAEQINDLYLHFGAGDSTEIKQEYVNLLKATE